jgi:putative heme-binding domain-containing protein
LLEVLSQDAATVAVAQQCMTTLAAKIRTGEIDQSLHSQFAKQLGPMLTSWLVDSSQFQDAATVLTGSLKMPQGLDACEHCVTDAKATVIRRISAYDSLQFGRPASALRVAKQLLSDNDVPVELQLGVAASMGRTNDAGVGSSLVEIIEKVRPPVVPVIVDVLTERAAWRRELVAAVESKRIAPEAVNINQLRKILSGDDSEIVSRAKAIWGTVRKDRNPAREQVVYEMRNLLKNNTGDPHKGQLAFNRLCGQCHKIHGQGQDVGPDITVNGRASLDQLLSNVFDPSLVIGRIYQAYTVITTDGRTLTGLLVEDNPQRIVLKVQGGKIETIARKDVDEFEQSKLSLMPEGVEKQLSPQELIDLLAFLRLDKSPSDPTARPIADVKK